jgi:hypothetical protein
VRSAWAPFRAAVEALPPGGLDREASGGWSVKEMLAHVAFWDEAVVGAVTGMIRGQPMPEGWGFGSGYIPSGEWPPAAVHNAREAAWARAQTDAAVLARFVNAHEAMVRFLQTVTDEEVAANAGYFGQLGGHYENHLSDLSP